MHRQAIQKDIMAQYNYEYAWDSQYCYPNSNVLINKLKIYNDKDLSVLERQLTARSMAEITISPIKGKFDFKHLCDIHYAIFHDVYEWAGQIRTVNISKGNNFCMANMIYEYSNDIFTKLKDEEFLRNCTPGQIPYRLAYYLSEINALHPFREGNGRTQRQFIDYLAKPLGCDIDYSQISPQEMIEASVDAFSLKYEKMNKIFERAVSPIII